MKEMEDKWGDALVGCEGDDLRVALDVVGVALHHGLALEVVDDAHDVVVVDDLDAVLEVDRSVYLH
jgi:hypothetical protein